MIFLLYGEDTYRSRKKVREILAEYRLKTGSVFNLHRIDAEEDDISILKSTLDTGALFAPKKLLLVSHAFSAVTQAHADLITSRAEELAGNNEQIVVMWDGALTPEQKKRAGALEKYATKAQGFARLEGAELVRWLRSEAKERTVHLDPAEERMLAASGLDSWTLAMWLDKKSLGADIAVAERENTTVFELGDAFLHSRSRALKTLLRLLEQGQDEFALFSYLVNHVRTLLVVKAYQETNMPIPQSAGINPFVVKKVGARVRTISENVLVRAIKRFFEEDVRIKTGLSTPKESLMSIIAG